MYVKSVKLINFRNYQTADIQLDSGLNFILGDNAQGKTNILESLYLCGTGKSHRTSNDRELIYWNKDVCFVSVNVESNQGEKSIKVAVHQKNGKKIKVNNYLIQKRSDLFGNLNIVMFSPEDLRLIKDGPAERRKFIDYELMQLRPRYYQLINEYRRILHQRNTLLKDFNLSKSRAKINTLEIWNHKLIETGSQLMLERDIFIKKLSFKSRLIHRKITNGSEELKLSYLSNVKLDGCSNYQEVKKRYQYEVQKNLQKDINFQTTTTGPHRDDLQFLVNNIDIKKFGSQGQQRTVVLTLKISQLELIKSEIGEYPVLLLDDVMSELDSDRQKFLMNTLVNVQTLITSTDMDIVNFFSKQNPRIINVANGKIGYKN